MAIRSMCADVDITGVETVEMKHVADGNRIRTYVLVALPTAGYANKDVKRGAKEAFKELDNMAREQKNENQVEITPVAPAKSQEISVVKPDGTASTLNLMPVENAEYKARRAEALQKPGAVVGQVSIAN
jgi:aspartate 1-decarboxylase